MEDRDPAADEVTGAMRLAVMVLAAFGLCASAGAADDTAAIADLQQRIERLDAAVQRAESIRAIKRLQQSYGHYAELGLWHDLAELFAADAVGRYPAGVITGQDALRALFFDTVGQGRLGLADGRLYPHIVLQPVVTLAADGKSARARWHVLAMLGGYGGTAAWVGGIYDNDYVNDNGVWKISELRYHTQFSGPYDTGWTQIRQPSADVPPSAHCENYLVNTCTIPFHYDVVRAGTPVLPPPEFDASAPGPPPADLAALRARFAGLEGRVARLNDESAVINLQHSYGYYLDRKLWDDVADLFAADATMELGQRGVYAGKRSIRRALGQFGPQGLREGELNDHLQLQTIVTIAADGRTARARGTELVMWGGVDNGEPRGEWRESIFENEYVKQDGVWRIAKLHVYPRLITDYELGWAKDARAAPGPSADFPPDDPPTEHYEIYPKFFIPPFHFDNPVTGEPTQYPQSAAAIDETRGRERASRAPAVRGLRTLADLRARLADSERDLRIAYAYDGAENVANAYSYYLDEFMWDETADLFAQDGWKEVSYVGVYAGRERIREALKARYPGAGRPAGFFAIHQTMQPVIHVAADGTSAKIRQRVFQPRGRVGGEGSWIAGIYENQVVLEGGVWKLSAMDLDYTWAAGYDDGWPGVASRPSGAEPELPPAGELTPDRPLRGPIAPPFPSVQDMAFHYKNPVTQRAPRLLLP